MIQITQLPHVKELREIECMFLFYHRFYLFAKNENNNNLLFFNKKILT